MSNRQTLLILDDDANVRAALVRLFHRDGYRMLEAANADAALALLEDHEVGVILCEPHAKNAEHFLHQVSQLYPLTRRVVLSGYTALKSVTDAINEGAVHKFFTKPWEDETLLAEVRQVFEQYQAAHDAATSYSILSRVKEEMERRVAQKLLESLRGLDGVHFSLDHADDLPIGVVTVEQGGKIGFANHKARQLLDFPADVEGLTAASLPAALARMVAADFHGGEAVWGETEWKDGGKMEFYCQHSISKNGEPAVIAVFLPKS